MVTSVVEAVARDLERLGGDVADSALAATALALAAEIDGANSATSKSMCARELRETMALLREQAPPAVVADRIDEVKSARERRRRRAEAQA